MGPGEQCGGQTWGTPGAMRTTRRSWERPGAAHPTARRMCKLTVCPGARGCGALAGSGFDSLGFAAPKGFGVSWELRSGPPSEIHPPPEFKFQWIRLHWVGTPHP